MFLVDPSHRRRVYGSHLYKLLNKCKGLNKTIVEVLIRNFGYALKQNRKAELPVLRTAMIAALEHEFNNHHFCSGEWCKYVSHPEVEWTKINVESGGKLKSKENNKEMYEMIRNVHELFLTDENLRMLNHEYDSQKNEALNKAFSKVAPKNMVFSKSRSLSD